MTARVPRTVPVRASAMLPADMLVEISLINDPDPKLVSNLNSLGFRAGDYPDLQVGPAGMLAAALPIIKGKSTGSRVGSVKCAETRELPPVQDAATYVRETIAGALGLLWSGLLHGNQDTSALLDAVVARTPDAEWASPVTIDRGTHLQGLPCWDATAPVWGTATLQLGA